MTLFNLFRIKVERLDTSPLFGSSSRTASEIIRSTIEKKPSIQIRKGPSWRIGNIQHITTDVGFFALGKITKSTRQLYDEIHGDIIEQSFNEAPHTYIVVDLQLQICAIAQKTRISARVINIAKNLEKLLNAAHEKDIDRQVTITLSEINDPEKFIEMISNAFRVTRFEITFSPPNPFDVDQQFHKPMEALAQATNAHQGKTSIKGEQLETAILENLARSAASAGNSANALIQADEKAKPVKKKLEGNPAIVAVEDIGTEDDKLSLVERIRNAYHQVRGSDQQS